MQMGYFGFFWNESGRLARSPGRFWTLPILQSCSVTMLCEAGWDLAVATRLPPRELMNGDG